MRKQPGNGRMVVDGKIVDKRNGTKKDGTPKTATVTPKGTPVLRDGVWYFDYEDHTPKIIEPEPVNLSLAKRLLAWFRRKAI